MCLLGVQFRRKLIILSNTAETYYIVCTINMSLEINRKYFGIRHLYIVFYRKVLPPFENYTGIIIVFSGLFMRDFHKFIEEISSGQIDQEMRTRTLRAFQIAEEIHQIIMPKSIKV